MARPQQLGHLTQALEKQLGSFVDLPRVEAPFTTVDGRPKVTDFSRDLMPRMGIERIQTQFLEELEGESGPSGERVFKDKNDIHDRIRFVGGWTNAQVPTQGLRVVTTSANSYLEVTFYGTGLNLLLSGSGHDVRASTDGGAESGNLVPANMSPLLTSRNYSHNIVLPVKAGLPLGLHTIKLRTGTGSLDIHGVEILNEASTIKTPVGSAFLGARKLSLLSLNSQAYNSAFESGVLGTRGGRVVVYLQDGQIKKVLTPTDGAQLSFPFASLFFVSLALVERMTLVSSRARASPTWLLRWTTAPLRSSAIRLGFTLMRRIGPSMLPTLAVRSR
jgi:hypothetical protein